MNVLALFYHGLEYIRESLLTLCFFLLSCSVNPTISTAAMTVLAAHNHILEMFKYMTDMTALNPPVLETYEASSCSLIERRQFDDMMQLANHILFLAQMQTQADMSIEVQRSIENWVLCGNPLPNIFIHETANLFASVGYRFRVMQWESSQYVCNEFPTINEQADPMEDVLDGTRIYQDYRCFAPWSTALHNNFHAMDTPPQHPPPQKSVYKQPLKPDFDCVGFASCNFCTKDKNYFYQHEASHWDGEYTSQSALAENARMLADWRDQETGSLINKYGKDIVRPTFANTTAIQMQRDLKLPDMIAQLSLNSCDWK
jgi:hypothetical protein